MTGSTNTGTTCTSASSVVIPKSAPYSTYPLPQTYAPHYQQSYVGVATPPAAAAYPYGYSASSNVLYGYPSSMETSKIGEKTSASGYQHNMNYHHSSASTSVNYGPNHSTTGSSGLTDHQLSYYHTSAAPNIVIDSSYYRSGGTQQTNGSYSTFANTSPLQPQMANAPVTSVLPLTIPLTVPAMAPSVVPSIASSSFPSMAPAMAPAMAPLMTPSMAPSMAPLIAPSMAPSIASSIAPTMAPAMAPTTVSSMAPLDYTSAPLSIAPTISQSMIPNLQMTTAPAMATISYSTTPITRPIVTATPATMKNNSNLELLSLLDQSIPTSPITAAVLEPLPHQTNTEIRNTELPNTLAKTTSKSKPSDAEPVTKLVSSPSESSVPLSLLQPVAPVVVTKDPLTDKEVLAKLTADVEKFDKLVDGLTRKSLNGPTPLDVKWKEVQELQEKESTKRSISVARCKIFRLHA